jgi:tripartite-type tricarboxylate transporter receptor subunit TctC
MFKRFIGALAALCAVAATPAWAQSESFTIVEPFGVGGPSEQAIRVLRPALERVLNARVLVEHIGGPSGEVALARVMTAPPGTRILLVITDASRIFHENLAKSPRRLDQLLPIAKLTDGISLCLAMAPDAPNTSWEAFAAAAVKEPPTIAAAPPTSPSGMFLGIVERHLGVAFPGRRYDLDAEVLSAMVRSHVPGVIATSTALSQTARGQPSPVVLLTSGARRHPALPDTPTLVDITGNRRLAFTMSVGLFAPPSMPDDAVKALTRAVMEAGKDEGARAEARRAHLPLSVQDAGVMRETMARTQRVIRELMEK